MKPAWLLLLPCLFLPSPGRAHELTVRPLRIELRCDSRKVRVTIKAHMLYWTEDILGVRRLPTTRWPTTLRGKAKDYIDSHFSLAVNGERLSGNLADCSYVEEFWKVSSGGTIVFRLAYPLPNRFLGGLPAGSTLSGRSNFYLEALGDLREIRDPAEVERETRWFRTDLFVLGRVGRYFVLTPGSTDFSAPWEESLRTSSQTAVEYFRDGFRWIFVHSALALLVLAAVLRLALPRPALWDSFCLLMIFTVSSLLFPHSVSEMGAPPEHLAIARGFFLAGIAGSSVLLAAVFYGFLFIYRARLQRIYASVWERVFLSHVRFLSQILIAVSAYFLFYDLIGRSG